MTSTVHYPRRRADVGLIALVLLLALSPPAAQAAAARAEQPLKPGEAIVWYLGHCGYAVKTATKFLVFDYSRHLQRRGEPPMQPPAHPGLATGWIDPNEIKGLDVIVFVTHGHADHYDEVIRSWAGTVGRIQHVFGWDAGEGPNVHSLAGPRAELRLGGVEIYTVNSHHDDVPESAFFVKVDGLALYHDGDYMGKASADAPSTVVEDMRYLRAKSASVDMAFVHAVASDTTLQIVRGLGPAAVFPTHRGLDVSKFAEFGTQLRQAGSDAIVFCPGKLGDRTEVHNGTIRLRR